ncbi:MAG: tripartite tricarboxylate transporter TctB family protein [Bacillota bacterium]
MKGKKIPFNAVMTLVVMLLVGLMAADGQFIQKLPSSATKYPFFIFSVVIVFGIVDIINSFRQQAAERGKERKPLFENRGNFLIITGMIIGYVLLMWLLGFVISTILFAVLFAWKFRLRHLIIFDLSAAVCIVALYVCFEKLLYIFLPTGLLFDKLF